MDGTARNVYKHMIFDVYINGAPEIFKRSKSLSSI